ncbi:FAD-dependent oxidoreductase [Paenibacillus sp. IB182496]|uniref:FAD-dependent oxidoreductase n=1 Tax=Paenibacillus sabuli TaxID=2772509 RepID=A0A927BWD8_9BACL|nr:FAD-dependent oxidoreductase [Paenibacillus sabuli]MBD2846724.1 FAD-dependent oxidoreductase [Paenibacillus sabuli]
MKYVNHAQPQLLLPVESVAGPAERYDVIVAGTDPEGVVAAISAARNGLTVLLVEQGRRDRLGGLMTVGWLNTLDFNYAPEQQRLLSLLRGPRLLNGGIFEEWYAKVEGSSFDTISAANAFYEMVQNEPNIDLLMHVRSMEPLTEAGRDGRSRVRGMRLALADGTTAQPQARTVIDATQDGDIAAAAGAPYTVGREDIGDPEARMVATLVFRMSGVTQDVWEQLGDYPDTEMDRMSIWGYNEASAYPSSDPERVKIRGLNIGRQNDGTILINAMHLYGIDPLDPASVAQGLERGHREAPRIAAYLRERFPAFATLEYAGTADELYIRESRHIRGEYRLRLSDLLANRDFDDAIAYGSYPVDIQSSSDGSGGTILMNPEQYGVPLRCLIPLAVDDLLVVGRAASFDSVPHGSARVIPLGMATGEAAGAAAELAMERGLGYRELAADPEAVRELRRRLTAQGMKLEAEQLDPPGYTQHKAYPGLVAAASLALTSGSYTNDAWQLDEPSNVQRFINALRRVGSVHQEAFAGDVTSGVISTDPAQWPKLALTLDQAARLVLAATGHELQDEGAAAQTVELGLIAAETLAHVADPEQLTNGDVFLLIRDLAAGQLGMTFE